MKVQYGNWVGVSSNSQYMSGLRRGTLRPSSKIGAVHYCAFFVSAKKSGDYYSFKREGRKAGDGARRRRERTEKRALPIHHPAGQNISIRRPFLICWDVKDRASRHEALPRPEAGPGYPRPSVSGVKLASERANVRTSPLFQTSCAQGIGIPAGVASMDEMSQCPLSF